MKLSQPEQLQTHFYKLCINNSITFKKDDYKSAMDDFIELVTDGISAEKSFALITTGYKLLEKDDG